MPSIEIDSQSGFCFGVVTAIRKAEEELARGGTLYCLGDIVHNSDEVERLRKKGLETITHDDLESLKGVKVLLRAHGEPPQTYDVARRNNIDIIDATCPVVLRLQQRIKAQYDNSAAADTQIVIYGKLGHAEVNGLVGQTNGTAIVVENLDGLSQIDFSRSVALYSQTTKSLEGFNAMIEEIKRRMKPGVSFSYADTICRQVASRGEHLRDFAAGKDVVVFVAGTKSSNGRVLYGHCKDVNPHTYLISNESELRREWFVGAETIGVCGATSTPRWLMERVRDILMSLQTSDS
ncbi:MAG: 4-hydroxy-3-methylbut-2-enyl diphosphate reductase [Muribaculaceae bacterium]|jgi:4-hydroxy-3-methylbut-2-enyl diphosphate reductase|nr:4-hydroxy-3-methylbut-2-enyl diphosphate reductase [Muribaculaceae bacterium]